MRRALLGLFGLLSVIFGMPYGAQGHSHEHYEKSRQMPIILQTHDNTWRAGDVELFKIVSQECAVEVGNYIRHTAPDYAPQLAMCVGDKMHLEHKPWLSVRSVP